MSSVAAYPCVHNNPSQLVNSSLIGMLRVGSYTYVYCKLQSYGMYLNLDFSRASHFIVSQESILHNTKTFYCVAIYIAYVFPHECIVLWVVKTTSLSFPGEYVIAPIVYSIHVLTINIIFNFHFVSWILPITL